MSGTGAAFRIRPARAWRVLCLSLFALAAAAALGWVWALAARGEEAQAWPALAVLPLLAWASTWRGEPGGRLLAEVGRWCFEDSARDLPPQPGRLIVCIDLGRWMLLRFRADEGAMPGGQRWFALSHSDMPGDWRAFRRAVYSPRLPPAGLSAQAPADPPA